VTVTVDAVNDSPDGTVTITGDAKTGQTLTASNDLTDADGMGTVSYQWSKDGVDVAGAINTTLALDDADIGSTFTVTANYTDGDGTVESEDSAATVAVVDIVKLIQIRDVVTTGSIILNEVDTGSGNPLIYTSYIDDGTVFTHQDASLEINKVDYSNGSTDAVIKFDLWFDAEGIDSLGASTITEIFGVDFVLDLGDVQNNYDNTSGFTSGNPDLWNDSDALADNDTEYMEWVSVSNVFDLQAVNESTGSFSLGKATVVVDTDSNTDTPLEVKIGTVYLNQKTGVTDLKITIQNHLFDVGEVNVEPLSYTVDIL
jgi:hypothetical protein